MVDIILPWPGGVPTSPWQKVTGRNGKHIRCTATPAQALVEGGSTVHYHNLLNFVCGYNTDSLFYGGSAASGYARKHNNHPLESPSVSAGQNNPPYQQFELIYMDAELWEEQERKFPQNAILLSDTIISWALVQRYNSADGRLIKIGDSPGSQGGSPDNVSHSVSFTLGNARGPASGTGTLNSGDKDPWSDHHHAGNGNTDAQTPWPKRVRTRIYIATVETDRALQGVICFFNGQPTASWTIISDWNDCFIESADVDATVTGNSINSHGGLNGTSGARSPASRISPFAGTAEHRTALYTHAHPWSCGVEPSNHEPEYVNLVAARLNQTLIPFKILSGAQIVGPMW